MGYFSWCFADKNNKKRLRIGERGYILTPDNQLIREDNYDGYGRFAGQDVYSLAADWNRDHLKEIIADKNLDDFTRQVAIKCEPPRPNQRFRRGFQRQDDTRLRLTSTDTVWASN